MRNDSPASLVFPIFVKDLSPPKADPPSEEKNRKNKNPPLGGFLSEYLL